MELNLVQSVKVETTAMIENGVFNGSASKLRTEAGHRMAIQQKVVSNSDPF
jgi:hypothetical protein